MLLREPVFIPSASCVSPVCLLESQVSQSRGLESHRGEPTKMAKKDKKSKAAEQKARVAAKQTKKAAQKEKKVKSKGANDSDAEDIDLVSVLEEYSKQVQPKSPFSRV